ncbi:MAG TPA: hypothetical protein VKE22_13605 [Haliangiales bacterium]|nr:hypothetical protein [Haliangiales bacterium]
MILADFHFSPRMRATVIQLVRAICPEASLASAVADQTERSFRSLPSTTRAALAAGLTTFELAAVVRYGRPFSRLDAGRARAWFEAWWHSPLPVLHEFVKGIRAILAYAYYEQPAVKRRLEYHPDAWIAEAARRRLAAYGPEIRRHERDLLEPQALSRNVRRA